MAQDIYAAARAHTKSVPLDNTPEAVLARYREAHPEDQNATVLTPGQEGYEGPATLDPQAQTYVKDRPLTESRMKAQVQAEGMLTANGDNAARENALMQGVLLNGADEVGGRAAQVGQMGRNLMLQLQGKPIEVNSSDLNDAYVDTFRRQESDFRRDAPVQAIGLNLVGGLLTGGATLGSGALGAAGTSGLYGAGSGFNGATGGFFDRLPSAAVGGGVGFVGGGLVQKGAEAATPYVTRLAGIAGVAGNPGGAARSATRRYGPSVGAASRLEGVIGPEQFAERARLQGLGLQPSVLDTLDNQGERLIRNAAGPAGPGADLAIRNARTRTVDLKPEVMAETRSLSGDPRSATEVREGLDATRSTLAESMYRPAYETQVPVTPEVLSALSDAPGRAALQRARQAAVARRNPQQVSEIDRILQLSDQEQAARNIDRLPEGPLNIPDAPTPSQMQRFARIERVPLSATRRTQNEMNWERFNRGDSPGDVVSGYGDRPVAVRREDGEYLIYDGHHRATQAVRQGQNDLEMYVIDAKDFAPDLAGRPSRPVDRNEIDSLLRDLGVEPSGATTTSGPTVSAGTLDRVRIAMGNRAEALGRNATGARDVAGGLRDRAGSIDNALSSVPELAPARATYSDLSGALEQIDNASAIFTADPQDFARTVSIMSPTQREAAVIGLRQEILDTLGGQKASGTGSIQRLAESNYARQNLEILLGPEEAGRYIANIEARVQQTQRAARVSPNTNSQTYGRTLDDEMQGAAQLVGAAVDGGQALTGNPFAIARTIDRIRSRATLSPEERSAIVQLGIGSADDLERIVQVAEMARSQGRPPPRAVRQYLERSRNVLGSQSPVAQQLEQLLLPARVLAEEQEQ